MFPFREAMKMSSNVILPECLMFFRIFLSRGESFKAFIIKEGTTDMLASLFCIVQQTSEVALAISSPTFFWDKPNGPIFGGNEKVAPTSPPTQRKYTNFTSLKPYLI
uniref:Uncharacterized protein n=1 Tax=Glossina pallidipes TaxID=7398 RepID=A0A1B0ABM4_GLOPL